ncbi:MAG TPA: universal stress protein [Gaiellaceae bacterium]|nr:universal stress protein [Gaiellaceae bacterium]
MSMIVVGVDRSAAAKEALRWAGEEARLRGAALRVVHAWQFPVAAVEAGFGGAYYGELLETLRRDAEALVEQLCAEAGVPEGVEVQRVAVEAAPAQALVDAAAEADLLVVGSRGHGGFAGLLLGSVSQQCAQHAPCPVVIVRPRPQPEGHASGG